MAEKIKIIFLGTGSAIPTARRNHPAVLLQFKDENILFDCGEGTQRQFRKAKLNPCKITKILISHWHGDHTLGIPGLLQTLVLNGYNKKLEIYGPRGTKKKVKEIMDIFMRWYLERGKRKLDLSVHEVSDGIFFDSGGFFIEAREVEHGVDTLGYAFVVKEKRRLDKKKLAKLKISGSPLVGELAKGMVIYIDGKKIDGKKLSYLEPIRKIAVVMDSRFCDGAVKIAKNADVLISEASFSSDESETAKEYNHMTSKDAARVAKKSGAKKLFLVHLSQRYETVPKIILEEAKKVFKNVGVPEDLDRVEL